MLRTQYSLALSVGKDAAHRAGTESEQGGVQMLSAWRMYEVMPGKLPALRTHLEVATSLYKKHGLGGLGFWIEEIGTSSQVM